MLHHNVALRNLQCLCGFPRFSLSTVPQRRGLNRKSNSTPVAPNPRGPKQPKGRVACLNVLKCTDNFFEDQPSLKGSARNWSLQLRVLCLGFFQDGNIGVGIFPESEEVLVGHARFGGVAFESVGSADLQMRERA